MSALIRKSAIIKFAIRNRPMLDSLRRKKSFRFIVISASLTVAAITTAIISAVAGQLGEYELSSLGSKAALALAFVIVLYVVPRLARSVKFEYLQTEISIHIPNSGLFFCALILVVTILALSSGNNLLYLVLAILLATMFVSWLASRICLGRVDVAVRFPDHIFVNETVPFDVTVTNRKRLLPTFSVAVALSEQSVAVSGREMIELAYYPIVPAQTQARMRVERSFAKRGVYPVRGSALTTKFPLGFIEQRRFIEASDEIVVYPQPQPLDDFFHLVPLSLGRVESRVKGSGSDLYAIRQYLSSDHHHHIDWKATAKTTQLMVREYTRDDDWRLTIAFDAKVAKQIADRPGFVEKFERAITLAASLLDYFINEGAEVRLVTDSDDSGFGIGQIHCYTMLRQLAQLALRIEEETTDGGTETTVLLAPEADDQFRVLITPTAQSPSPNQPLHSAHVITFEEL